MTDLGLIKNWIVAKYFPLFPVLAILQLEWVDNRLKADFGCLQGGAAVPAAPTMPTEQTIGDNLPTEFTEPTEFSGARYSPTDCTDAHRLGGYGILPYPRSHQTIFPQKPQNLTQPNHL